MIALALVCYLFFLGLICIPVFIITVVVQLFRIRKMSRSAYPCLQPVITIEDDVEEYEEEECGMTSAKTCCFYTPEQEKINREDFVRLYNSSYYLGNHRALKGVTQNSRFVEDKIDDILQKGIRSGEDVFLVMAWKMGAIEQVTSEKAQKIVYRGDIETGILTPPQRRPVYLGEFSKLVADHITELEKKAEKDPQGVLNWLKINAPKGVGTVNFISLLYFISKAKYPIYDKYAMMAIDAIIAGKKIGETVGYNALPNRNSINFNTLVHTHYKDYIEKIETVFGESYYLNRDTDRALWVYGHGFRY